MKNTVYFFEKVLRQASNVIIFFFAANYLSPLDFTNYNLILVSFAIFSPLLFFVQEPILLKSATQIWKTNILLSLQVLFTIIFIIVMIGLHHELAYLFSLILPLSVFRIYELRRYQNFSEVKSHRNGIIDLASITLTFPLKAYAIHSHDINLLATCIMLDYLIPAVLFGIQSKLKVSAHKIYDLRAVFRLLTTPKIMCFILALCVPSFLAGLLQGLGTRMVFRFAEQTMTTIHLGAFFILIRIIDFSANIINVCSPLFQVQFRQLAKARGRVIVRSLILSIAVLMLSLLMIAFLAPMADLLFPVYSEIVVSCLFLLPPVITLMCANIFLNILHYERSQTKDIFGKSLILVAIMAILVFIFKDISIMTALLAFTIAYTLQLMLSVWRLNVLNIQSLR